MITMKDSISPMKVLLTVITVLCFSIEAASVADQDKILLKDGSVIDTSEGGGEAESLSAAPSQGTAQGMSEEELRKALITDGVNLEPVDVEAISRIKPMPEGGAGVQQVTEGGGIERSGNLPPRPLKQP